MRVTAPGERRVGEASAAGIETGSAQRLAAAERSSTPTVLVAYASKHGATQGIAERVAGTLRAAGLVIDLRPAKAAGDPAAYDACVVGSAAHMGSWLAEATTFVRATRAPWPAGRCGCSTAARPARSAPKPRGVTCAS
jgi:hypothetical protein